MYSFGYLFMIIMLGVGLVVAYSLYNMLRAQQENNIILNKILEAFEKRKNE